MRTMSEIWADIEKLGRPEVLFEAFMNKIQLPDQETLRREIAESWKSDKPYGRTSEGPRKEEILQQLEGAHILVYYHVGGYEMDAFCLYAKDCKFYTVHGSHCSCYGLEGQWEPEETSLEYIKRIESIRKHSEANNDDHIVAMWAQYRNFFELDEDYPREKMWY